MADSHRAPWYCPTLAILGSSRNWDMDKFVWDLIREGR